MAYMLRLHHLLTLWLLWTSVSSNVKYLLKNIESKDDMPTGFRTVPAPYLVSGGTCVHGWILLLKLLFTLLNPVVRQNQVPYWVCKHSQNFQAKTIPSKTFYYFGRKKCNQHIFSVCFQISKMCENAPQNIFNREYATNIWKF